MSSELNYTRTTFEEDDPPPVEFSTAVGDKRGPGIFHCRRTWLKFVLAVILGILSLVIIVLAALLAIRTAAPKSKQEEICLTPECINVASSLLTAMDRTVDPCQDFYSYACGGWQKTHSIPAGKSRFNRFSELSEENQQVLKRVIETPINSSEGDAERKAKLYYQSCMDKNKTIETLKGQPLLDFVRNIGGWSISNKSGIWNSSRWTLQKALEKTKIFGVLFSFHVGADDKNSSSNIIQVYHGGLGLPERDYYLNKSIDEDKVLTAYLDYMTTVGVLLGGEENTTRDQMYDVIEFETQLANITVPNEERRDMEHLYHKMTIKDVQKLAPFIDWVKLLNSLLSSADIVIDDTEDAIIYVPGYLENITKIIQNLLSTENGKRTLNNYLVWHVVKTMTPYLSTIFRDARAGLTEAITGTTGEEEHWRHCISDTDGVMGFALGSLFVKEVFRGDSREKAEAMIKGVKTAFKNNLSFLSWMDQATRIAAIDKANAVIDMIGFPEYILNTTRLDKEYEGLTINVSEYLENSIRNLYFRLMKDTEKLRKIPDPDVWDMNPQAVNAYYTQTKNEIVFPAGILQAPFYSQNYPKFLNFGAMGVVMGHELTHGFDDQGREYDKFGNLRPWWNNASIARFQNRTNCMVDQYSQYKLNDDNVRGNQTLSENIADNGGLKAAFHAYEDWVSHNGEEIPLPGLNLTNRQVFFLGFSQVWCSISTKEADHLQILADPHSPGQFRVIGTLSNSYEFAKAYNCPRPSPMNPINKCVVW